MEWEKTFIKVRKQIISFSRVITSNGMRQYIEGRFIGGSSEIVFRFLRAVNILDQWRQESKIFLSFIHFYLKKMNTCFNKADSQFYKIN